MKDDSLAVFSVVEFLRPWGRYQTGDRAPMRDWLGEILVEAGTARCITAVIPAPQLLLIVKG